MKSATQKWLYGLNSAMIGGGSSAVVSGLTSMGFAPDKFNLANASGVWHLLGLMFANFLVSAILSAFFYLRQSPLPAETFTETVTAARVTKDPETGATTATVSNTVTSNEPLSGTNNKP